MGFPQFPEPNTRKKAMYSLNQAFAPVQARSLYNLIPPEIAMVDTAATARVNSTLLVDPQLLVDVLAGVPYIVTATLFVTTTATPGFQFDFNGGTATLATNGLKGRSTFSTAAAAALAYVDPVALATANNPAAAAYTQVRFDGVILMATSGTLGIRWAQSVTNATGSTVDRQSFLKVEPAVALFGR
jgi:hypothetical protein